MLSHHPEMSVLCTNWYLECNQTCESSHKNGQELAGVSSQVLPSFCVAFV